MKLSRCTAQAPKSLDEFYEEVARGDTSADGGQAMLSLIDRLRQLPDERPVWGLTSHYRLCLLSEDDWETPRFVTISALDRRNYFVEYLMPERLAPWPSAYVTGQAESEDDAIRMILTAMDRSEGWTSKG